MKRSLPKSKNELSEVPQVWKVPTWRNFLRASKLERNPRGPVASVIAVFSFVWIRSSQRQKQANKQNKSFFSSAIEWHSNFRARRAGLSSESVPKTSICGLCCPALLHNPALPLNRPLRLLRGHMMTFCPCLVLAYTLSPLSSPASLAYLFQCPSHYSSYLLTP